MKNTAPPAHKLIRRVVVLSILLLYFTLPHTLEDFATGEPAEAGIPAPVISTVVATVFALQGLGLYWLGQDRRRGLRVQAGIGIFWPLAAGLAQAPAILGEGIAYRAGFISIFYVAGILLVGLGLLAASVHALRAGN